MPSENPPLAEPALACHGTVQVRSYQEDDGAPHQYPRPKDNYGRIEVEEPGPGLERALLHVHREKLGDAEEHLHAKWTG